MACKRLGFQRVTPNDLRHTFVSWVKKSGVESYRVAKLLGHTSSRMVELVYGHLDAVAMAQAMGELPKLSPALRRRRSTKPGLFTPKLRRKPSPIGLLY